MVCVGDGEAEDLRQLLGDADFGKDGSWILLLPTSMDPGPTLIWQRLYFLQQVPPGALVLFERYRMNGRVRQATLGVVGGAGGAGGGRVSLELQEDFQIRRANFEGTRMRVVVETKKPFEIVTGGINNLGFFWATTRCRKDRYVLWQDS